MNKRNKREIIKNIAIVFLVIMLILTFFSNTIMNRTLPEVSTQSVTSGSVTTQVRGEGVVEAESPYNIVIDETRKVKGLAKHVGDHVEIGDVIYTLTGESGEELTTAKNDLETLKGDYELAVIESGLSQAEVAAVQAGVTFNSSTILSTLENKDKEITSLKDQLKEKEKKQSENSYQMSLIDSGSSYSDYTNEERAVENAQAAVDTAQAEFDAASNTYNGYNEAKNIVNTKNQAVINYQSAYNAYYGYTKEDGTVVKGAKADYEEAEMNYANAQTAYQSKCADYKNASDDYETKKADYLATDPSDSTRSDKEAAMNQAEAVMNQAKDLMDKSLADKEAYENALNACKDAKDVAYSALTTAESALREAEQLAANAPTDEQLAQAEADKNAKEAALNAKKAELAKAQEALNNKKNSDNSNNSKNKQNLDSLKKTDHELTVAINDLKEKITKLESDRDKYLSEEKTKINLEKKYQEILKKEKEVKDLEDKALGGEITSPVAGEITSLAYSAGEKIEAGSTAAVIQIDGKGYKLSFPVTAKQAKAVKVGDEVNVENSWYYGDITVNLVAIQPDKNNTRDGKLLVFSLSGDGVQVGQNMTLSVGERSSNYDFIVPLSSLKEDNNGNFILILDQKSTPFGSRYVAKRVDVKVLAKDDKVAAVDGELMGWEYVITNSSKDLENKDQVKLAE
ncbi:MAG: HlyD family efflux transporter periplasmic adaptor subunit [Lachnospiraceae bacterium]|nr:HlyD family efflux transporter periplasmic adaptor subunit [Lachnospiraceae bacterium]